MEWNLIIQNTKHYDVNVFLRTLVGEVFGYRSNLVYTFLDNLTIQSTNKDKTWGWQQTHLWIETEWVPNLPAENFRNLTMSECRYVTICNAVTMCWKSKRIMMSLGGQELEGEADGVSDEGDILAKLVCWMRRLWHGGQWKWSWEQDIDEYSIKGHCNMGWGMERRLVR